MCLHMLFNINKQKYNKLTWDPAIANKNNSTIQSIPDAQNQAPPYIFSNAISRQIRTYFTRWLIRTILYDLSKPQWRVGLGAGLAVGYFS